jgi:hypothetical protein
LSDLQADPAMHWLYDRLASHGLARISHNVASARPPDLS